MDSLRSRMPTMATLVKWFMVAIGENCSKLQLCNSKIDDKMRSCKLFCVVGFSLVNERAADPCQPLFVPATLEV